MSEPRLQNECYDCTFHRIITYCGCHCHDEDACLKNLKIYGEYGLTRCVCDDFEKKNKEDHSVRNVYMTQLAFKKYLEEHKNKQE